MRAGIRSVLATSMLLLSLILAVSVHTEQVKGTGTPEITISIDQVSQTADMEDVDHMELTFTGTLEVIIPFEIPNQVIEVTLEVIEDHFDYRFDPSLMVFNQSGTENFTFKVGVGLNVPAGDNELSVGGTWNYNPGLMTGNIEHATTQVIVTDHPGLELITPSSIDVYEGNTTSLDILVNNTGNVEVGFTLEFYGIDDLERRGIIVDSPNSGNLIVDFSSIYTYTMNLTGDEIGRDSTLDMEVLLLGAESGEEYDESSVVVNIFEAEEPSNGGGDGDNGGDQDTDEDGDGTDGNGEGNETGPIIPQEGSGGLSSTTVVLFLIAGIVLIVIAVIVYFVFRKTGKS